jgi:hypothetical protein
MKRDFTMPENKQESVETVEPEGVERRTDGYHYAFAQTDDPCVAEAVAQCVFEPISEQARQHVAEIEAEHHGGHLLLAADMVRMNRLHEKLPIIRGAHPLERFKGHDAERPPDGGSQTDIEGMLKRVLTAGGNQIIERLKEYDKQIAAEHCPQPEIGKWVKAHYVPLLLSALELDDEEFDAEYPGANCVSSEDRAALAETIKAHAEDCPRCSLKIASDNEWDEYVNGAFGKAKRRLRIYG